MPTSHDQNFKNLILDYPRESLLLFAPSEAPQPTDQVTFVPVRQEQLKERLRDRFRELDVPLLVEWQDGRREALLFVLEEETDPRRFSRHRLAHYCLDLAELMETDRVVPVVIFLRPGPRAPALALGSEHHRYLTFDYLAFDLANQPFERWADSDNLVARLNLPSMRYQPAQKIEVYARAMQGLQQLEPDTAKWHKYFDFVDIYANLTPSELRLYAEKYPQEIDTMSGFAERFRQQGIEQGIEQGLEQGIEKGIERGIERGIEQGERTLLTRQLERRFGPLSPATRERLDAATIDDLNRWADNIIDATSLDDVFA